VALFILPEQTKGISAEELPLSFLHSSVTVPLTFKP
jgi:hypothetical protein